MASIPNEQAALGLLEEGTNERRELLVDAVNAFAHAKAADAESQPRVHFMRIKARELRAKRAKFLREGLLFEILLFCLVGVGVPFERLVSDADGVLLGLAGAHLFVVPFVTFSGVLIAFAQPEPGERWKGAGTILAYCVFLPMAPLAVSLAMCRWATCVSDTWRAAMWLAATACPLGSASWGVLHLYANSRRFGHISVFVISSLMCGLILLPIGVILPLWAASDWGGWDTFFTGDPLYICLLAMCVGLLLINYRTVLAMQPAGLETSTRQAQHMFIIGLFTVNMLTQGYILTHLRFADPSETQRNLLLMLSLGLLSLISCTTFILGTGAPAHIKLTVLVWMMVLAPVATCLSFKGSDRSPLIGLLLVVYPLCAALVCAVLVWVSGRGQASRQTSHVVVQVVLGAGGVLLTAILTAHWLHLWGGTSASTGMAVALIVLAPLCVLAGAVIMRREGGDGTREIEEEAEADEIEARIRSASSDGAHRSWSPSKPRRSGFRPSRFRSGSGNGSEDLSQSRHGSGESGESKASGVGSALAAAGEVGERDKPRGWKVQFLSKKAEELMNRMRQGVFFEAMASSFVHILFALSMTTFLVVQFDYPAKEGGFGMMLVMLLVAPVAFYGAVLGSLRYPEILNLHLPWATLRMLFLSMLIGPGALAAALSLLWDDLSDNVRWGGTMLAVAIPGTVCMWLLMWIVPGFALHVTHHLPEWIKDHAFFLCSMNFICILAVLPFGVVFPAALASSYWEDLDSQDQCEGDSRSRSIDMVYSYLSYYSCTLVMVVMGGCSIMLNEKLNKMEAELQRTRGVALIRKACRKISVVVDIVIARLVYDEIQTIGFDETKELLTSQELLTWTPLAGEAMRVCLVSDVTDGDKDDPALGAGPTTKGIGGVKNLIASAIVSGANMRKSDVGEGALPVLTAEIEDAAASTSDAQLRAPAGPQAVTEGLEESRAAELRGMKFLPSLGRRSRGPQLLNLSTLHSTLLDLLMCRLCGGGVRNKRRSHRWTAATRGSAIQKMKLAAAETKLMAESEPEQGATVWQQAVRKMWAQQVLRSEWELVPRKRQVQQGDLYLVLLPVLFERFSHVHEREEPSDDEDEMDLTWTSRQRRWEARLHPSSGGEVHPVPGSGHLKSMSLEEYRALVAFIFPSGLPGKRQYDRQLGAVADEGSGLLPSTRIVSDLTYIMMTKQEGGSLVEGLRPMDFPRFTQALKVVAEQAFPAGYCNTEPNDEGGNAGAEPSEAAFGSPASPPLPMGAPPDGRPRHGRKRAGRRLRNQQQARYDPFPRQPLMATPCGGPICDLAPRPSHDTPHLGSSAPACWLSGLWFLHRRFLESTPSCVFL
ncbi:hypothetical protein CYMTET_5033 [Cymbomonas tetramitiformis]|uniref:Uncharacterized protein n=1 Tax=Cymbomonas tetramitiformis TaxID=36881 RepID=A0AAE0LJV2_9CHLO|nr:hypothetical protein CYMTET_5033 [Cymbomonas tetramitiformis]